MSSRVKQRQAVRAAREQAERARKGRNRRWAPVAALALLLVAGTIGYAVYDAQRPPSEFAAPAGATADRTGVAVGSGPVTVELYLDYLCPACRAFEEASGPTLKKYLAGGKVTVVYHPVAILDRYSTNQYSTRAAAGAGCAADAGKLVEYSEALYAQQPAEGGAGHTNDQLITIATGAGLPDSFGQCLGDQVYADWVGHVTAGMSQRGVRGTPTVFVNGVQLADPSPDKLAMAIDSA